MTAVRHVNHPRGIREQHLIKELCGRSGIMGYVTFHHKTRRAPLMVPLTWETAAVVFLTTAARRGEPSEIHSVDAPESAARCSLLLVPLFTLMNVSKCGAFMSKRVCRERDDGSCFWRTATCHYLKIISWADLTVVFMSLSITLILLSVMHCNQCNKSAKFDLYCSNCTL